MMSRFHFKAPILAVPTVWNGVIPKYIYLFPFALQVSSNVTFLISLPCLPFLNFYPNITCVLLLYVLVYHYLQTYYLCCLFTVLMIGCVLSASSTQKKAHERHLFIVFTVTSPRCRLRPGIYLGLNKCFLNSTCNFICLSQPRKVDIICALS